MTAEETLRLHIGQIMREAGIELTPALVQTVEDKVIQLFREYAKAHKNERDYIYSVGEAEILKIISLAKYETSLYSPTGKTIAH